MPAWMPRPAKANTPDIGIEPPITMSSLACACAPPASASAAVATIAPSVARRDFEIAMCSSSVDAVLWARPRMAGSGPERVQVEEPAHAAPHFREPMRLEDQESDDQRPEHDRAHRREHDRRILDRDPADDQLEQLRDHGHEHRPEDAAQDGAHAA